MRVHLIKRQTIDDFVYLFENSRTGFDLWLNTLHHADWYNPQDIVKTFASADILGKGCNRVIFNIGGNKFRIICKYKFGANRVHLFVCWIGTHADYNALCAKNEQYTISKY